MIKRNPARYKKEGVDYIGSVVDYLENIAKRTDRALSARDPNTSLRDQFYLHFSDFYTAKLNFKSGWSTPTGLYTYPCTSLVVKRILERRTWFRENADNIYVLQPKRVKGLEFLYASSLSYATYTKIKEYLWALIVDKIETICGGVALAPYSARPDITVSATTSLYPAIERGIEFSIRAGYIDGSPQCISNFYSNLNNVEKSHDVKHDATGRLQTLWWLSWNLNAGKPIQWNGSWLELGVAGVIDDVGAGIIHENEPIQAVFFHPKSFEIVEAVLNPTQKKSMQERGKAPGYKYIAQIKKQAKEDSVFRSFVVQHRYERARQYISDIQILHGVIFNVPFGSEATANAELTAFQDIKEQYNKEFVYEHDAVEHLMGAYLYRRFEEDTTLACKYEEPILRRFMPFYEYWDDILEDFPQIPEIINKYVELDLLTYDTEESLSGDLDIIRNDIKQKLAGRMFAILITPELHSKFTVLQQLIYDQQMDCED